MSNINSKSFNLYRRVSKSFVLLISGFSVSNTFLFFCRIRHRMTVAMKFAQKLTSAIRLGRNRITITKFTLRQKQTAAIAIRSLRMTITSKLSQTWPSSLIGSSGRFRMRMVLTFVPRQIERWFSTAISLGRIRLGRNVIVFNPTLASYNRLSTTDTQLLSALDILTLNDMDYVIT